MATFSKAKLSASSDWKPVSVAATATAWTLIHTAVSGTTQFDEVWIWAVNTSSTNVKLTIEYGDAATSSNIEYTVWAEDWLKLVVPWLILQNWATVRAFAATANVISLSWFINQIR